MRDNGLCCALRYTAGGEKRRRRGGGESIFKLLRTIQIINWWPVVQGKKGKEESAASPPFVFRERYFAIALLTSYMSYIGIVYRILPPLSFIFNFSMFLITASEFSNVWKKKKKKKKYWKGKLDLFHFAAGRVLRKFGRFTKALADVTTRLIDYSASLYISACVQSWKNGHFTKVKKKKEKSETNQKPVSDCEQVNGENPMELDIFSFTNLQRESIWRNVQPFKRKDELPNQIKMAKHEKIWPPSRIPFCVSAK